MLVSKHLVYENINTSKFTFIIKYNLIYIYKLINQQCFDSRDFERIFF